MVKNQFEVFGVDVRDYGRLWLSAWRDLLFGDDSPIRNALDSPITLKHTDGSLETFQAGCPVPRQATQVEALSLPDDLVLTRKLTLPAIAEADLDAALHLEVSACSPFAADDTAAGWRVGRSNDLKTLTVDLAIVSRSAAMAYLGEHHGLLRPTAAEVWAQVESGWLRVKGFGEARREEGYRRRLVRTGLLLSVAVVLVLALAGVVALLSGRELVRLEALQVEARRDAREAIMLRDQLAATNIAISELNKLSRRLPNPQVELARLTELLPDTAYITQYTQDGLKIRLRGRGSEAASLQQALTEDDAFASVAAPQAISRVGTTGLEQFFLDINLKVNR